MDPNTQKKILSAKVSAAVVSKDESTISRITGQLHACMHGWMGWIYMYIRTYVLQCSLNGVHVY